MNQDLDIKNELKETAPVLASLERQLPYSIPAGYFEQLADSLIERVLLQDAGNLAAAPGMQVPEGYFEQLPQTILARIKSQEEQLELQEVAPVLASMNKQMPYTVPAGYFEQLNPMAFSQPKVAGAKTVRLFSGKMYLRVAAAIVLLLAAFVVWKMSGQTKSADVPVEITLKPADSIMLHESLAAIDDTSLNTYFNDQGVAQEVKSVGIMLETDNIENALSSFSESDLQTQLTENPVPVSESGI